MFMFVSFSDATLTSILPLGSRLAVAKGYSIFLVFNWLISACLIKPAAFV